MGATAEDWEGAAAELLDATCTTAPVDAYALAAACGFDVRHWSSAGAAREGDTIKVNPRVRVVRRHGLIAHELGHFALERARLEDTEQGAKYVGGALMLPARETRRDLAQTAWSIAKMRTRHVNASATAIAVRITQLRDAVATIVDPDDRVAPWRVWSPWLSDPRIQRLSPWERGLVRRAIDVGDEVRGDELCYALPLIDGTWRRVIVVCEAEQLSLRL